MYRPKISDLVNELQWVQERYGDLEVAEYSAKFGELEDVDTKMGKGRQVMDGHSSPDDAEVLRQYLGTLPVAEVRGLAANGMRYRHESSKGEIIAWLVRYIPNDVRRHRTATTNTEGK